MSKKDKKKEFIYNDQYHVKWRRKDPNTGFWTTEEDWSVMVPLVGKNKEKEKELHDEAIKIIRDRYKGHELEIVSVKYC